MEVLSSVPLFPLPNVVLFPRAVLPLHIFEERYKDMTADALAGPRLVAMALLRPGWETQYYGRAPVHPVVCVGRILTHEKLRDGKYNFLLQGQVRARIVREHCGRPYRQVELEELPRPPFLEIDVYEYRQRLVELFAQGGLGVLPIAGQVRQMLSGPMNTVDVGDLIAYNLLDDIPLKQSLLAEPDARARLAGLLRALEAMAPAARRGALGYADASVN